MMPRSLRPFTGDDFVKVAGSGMKRGADRGAWRLLPGQGAGGRAELDLAVTIENLVTVRSSLNFYKYSIDSVPPSLYVSH